MIAALLLAAGPLVPHLSDPPSRTEPALRGLDPVLLCEESAETPGRQDLQVTHGRFTYCFSGAETRVRFLDDPERFGIQWGGGCGAMGPLSGIGSPERWAVHAGRIYIFASDGCREGFLDAPERFVVAPAEPPTFPEEEGEVRWKAGAAMLLQAVRAHGGVQAIDAPRALRLVYQGTQDDWTHRIELVFTRDALERSSIWTPPADGAAREVTRWVLAESAFVDEGGAVFPVTSPDQVLDLRRFAHREPIALLWASAGSDLLAAWTGTSKLPGNPGVRVVDVIVHHAGLVTTLHLDPESCKILGLSWRGRAIDGVTRDVVEVFTDWRDVGGALIPTGRTVMVDGEVTPSLALTWNTAELLARVPAHSFERGVR